MSFFAYSWFLSVLKSAMVKGCREPPYPSVLTDATMEKLALTKFVSQESHCEVKICLTSATALHHTHDNVNNNPVMMEQNYQAGN